MKYRFIMGKESDEFKSRGLLRNCFGQGGRQRQVIPCCSNNLRGFPPAVSGMMFLKEHVDVRTAIEERLRRDLGLVQEQEPQPV